MTGQTLQSWLKRSQEKGREVQQRLMGIPPVQLVVRVVQELGHDDATHFAAGVAYYAFLSIFPLLLGLIALASFFLEQQAVQAQIFDFVNTNIPAAAGMVEQNINAVQRLRGPLGIASIAGLFWAASAVFGAISRAINRAWDIRQDRPFYIAKPRQLLMALAVGLLFFASAGIDTFRALLTRFDFGLVQVVPIIGTIAFDILARLLMLGIAFVTFLLIYKLIPNTQTYWRDVWPGALLAAVLFEAGKAAFVFYLNNFANYQQVYGSLASIVILLVWLYFSGLILIIGAELASEKTRMRLGVERGAPLPGEEAQEADGPPAR